MITVYSILSIQYEVPLISKVKPIGLPINLAPSGDRGDKAMTLIPSTDIFGKATLKYK